MYYLWKMSQLFYHWVQMVLCQAIGLMSRVFTYGPVNQGSIPGQALPKTQKMGLDAALLNTQHYKVRIKGKVEQSKKRSSAPPLHLDIVVIENGTFSVHLCQRLPTLFTLLIDCPWQRASIQDALYSTLMLHGSKLKVNNLLIFNWNNSHINNQLSC